MTIQELLLLEFDEEMANTRRMLERVPEASLSGKPHDKSMTLGRLGSHIADLPNRCVSIVSTDVYVRPAHATPFVAGSAKELLEHFVKASGDACGALRGLRDEQLAGRWTLKFGDRTMVELPRAMALRRVFLDHLIHHRGQLSVYLRMLNVPIPGMYGPSADDAR
ncbi:MAG TPA: DinB family protein [Acidobacteriaceae bacterium]|nr:DinB family protein [Acidobacteriaceae bacterium]